MTITDKILIAAGMSPAQCSIWLPEIQAACDRFQIDTSARLFAFLAQTAHESGSFTRLVENLNYSAEALLKMFSGYFNADEIDRYARQPEMIANRIYANRMGNGTEESGDGWKYRGRGLIQITGRDNYRAYSMAIEGDASLMLDPSPLSLPPHAALSAAWFWYSRGLNLLADLGNFRAITIRINNGLNGYADRTARWEAIKNA